MDENYKFRHELKYQCSEEQLLVIQNRLKNLLAVDSHADGGQYSIRSVYFDNYQNRCFFDNENGVDSREKFRIRIYNASDNRIALECKQKENGKTHKIANLLTKEQFDDIMSGGSLENLSQKPELLRKFLILMKTQLFRPAVIVEYERIPYVYPIGNVRITLDKNIRSSNNFDDFFAPNLSTRPILPNGQQLIEVKYDEFLPDYIKEVLQIGELQRTTFSKYYLCRKYSNGGL